MPRTTKVREATANYAAAKPSALVDTRVVYCGDNLDQLQKLPAARAGKRLCSIP